MLIINVLFADNQTKTNRNRTSGNKKSILARVSAAAGIDLRRLPQKTTASQSNRSKYSTGDSSAHQSTELSINLEGKKGKDTTKTSDVTPPDSDHKVQVAEEPSATADIRDTIEEESGGYERELSIRPEELEEGDVDEPLPFLHSTKSIDDVIGDVVSFIGSVKASARVAAEADIISTKNESCHDDTNVILPFEAPAAGEIA